MTDQIHVSTKDRPGDYDAIETAKPDEPLFPLQGGDPLAPATVQFWAEFARARSRALLQGGKVYVPPLSFGLIDAPENYEPSETDQAEAQRLLRKATQAEEVSWAFLAYQRNEQEPTGGRATYNEIEEPPADELERLNQRKALINMAGQLHNGLAIANTVREGLEELDLHPDVASVIAEAVEQLKLAAAAIEPRRAGERS